MSYTDAGKLILIPWFFYIVCAITMGKVLSMKPKWRRTVYFVGTSGYFILMLGLYLIPNTDQPTFWNYAYIAIFLSWISFCLAVDYVGLTTAVVYVVSQRA